MTLSLNCKEAGDPVCTHTMYGETEEELLANAKKHGMEVHGYTEETWNEEVVYIGIAYPMQRSLSNSLLLDRYTSLQIIVILL